MLQSFVVHSGGESLTIPLSDPSESGFIVQSVDGLGPVNAAINTTEIVTTDGSRFNSARLSQRNIVFHFLFDEGNSESIPNIRRKSYSFFSPKKKITIDIHTELRTYTIDGYVESNEPDIFSKNEGCQISVICPDPYFYYLDGENGITRVDFNSHESLLEFPISNEIGNDTYSDSVSGELSSMRFSSLSPIEIDAAYSGTLIRYNEDHSEATEYSIVHDGVSGKNFVNLTAIEGVNDFKLNGENVVDFQNIRIINGNISGDKNHFSITVLSSGNSAVEYDIPSKFLGKTIRFNGRIERPNSGYSYTNEVALQLAYRPSQGTAWVYYTIVRYENGIADINSATYMVPSSAVDAMFRIIISPSVDDCSGAVADFYDISAYDDEANNTFEAILFEFGRIDPTSLRNIEYNGDSEVGVIITLHANGTVVNPTIHNITTNQAITIDSSKISGGIRNGDEIIISTIKGSKSATLLRGTTTTNILSSLGSNIPWFTLTPGSNSFSLSASSGAANIEARMEFRTRFEGV